MPGSELADQLQLAGASPADIAWFASIGWSDANVPEIEPADVANYERREAILNATLKAETFAERGESLAGRLAAAIGARLADLREKQEEDD